MAISHAMASGMGGVRTSGDLVARMQMTRGMRLKEAKKYVADKLGVSVEEMVDPVIMDEVRADLQIGRTHQIANDAIGIEAKHNIAKLLDIKINCVEKFKQRIR